MIYRESCKIINMNLTTSLDDETITLVKANERTNRTGERAKMTSVNFHPRIKPMMRPAKKVDRNWIQLLNLSPMPSLILLISLQERKNP